MVSRISRVIFARSIGWGADKRDAVVAKHGGVGRVYRHHTRGLASVALNLVFLPVDVHEY